MGCGGRTGCLLQLWASRAPGSKIVPSAAGGRGRGGLPFSSCPRFGGACGNGDRFSGERHQYGDNRYDGGCYGDGDRFDNQDYKYGGHDHYTSCRYPTSGDWFPSDRYGGGSNYPQNGYGIERAMTDTAVHE
ncbi:PREDICTED: glycine-rich RNA-binding protein RZ1B-like [Lupinus angustifolius]|uniref:glycine-rich RNA-binding protein RZ1B-like n=1 Tax=Lupinus angustifolius TaxID=3871 RepID=UPI00092E97CE|nr:PREDICTED: glycine-rich RNA-binding protein RZ1B-like [Lupinus angustifolius]